MSKLIVIVALMIASAAVASTDEGLKNNNGQREKEKKEAENESLPLKVSEGIDFHLSRILQSEQKHSHKEGSSNYIFQAADLGSAKAVQRIAYALLFGDHFPQNVGTAKTLFESLAKEGFPRSQTALGFMHAAGIGFHQNQARALVYYTFAGLGGDLRAKMILGYRYWSGINMPKNCEAAVIQYRKVAHHVAKKLSSVQHGEVELVRILETPENYSTKAGIMDLDLYQYYKFVAERGDIQTQVTLGNLHLYGGKGLERDSHKAVYYFSKAVNAGSTNAIAFLGKMYFEGTEATPQDNETAFHYFKLAADRGNPIGLTGLGVMYLYGKGIPVNYTMALRYMKKAAEKDWMDGIFHLGVIYLFGFGVPRDLKVASRYFAFASKHGHHLSHYYLAEMYATGKGAQRSCDIAVKLYMEVCKLGSWSEMFLSAYFAYKEGDMDSALVQYLLLGEMGFEEAQSNAAYLLESNVSRIFRAAEMYPLAFLQWRRAAAQGYALARIKIGDYHYYGYGTDVDYEAAVIHYRLAAEQQGSAQAMFNLGYMYEQGKGLKKDIHLALRMYDMAVATSSDAHFPVLLATCKLSIVKLFRDYQNSREEEQLPAPKRKKGRNGRPHKKGKKPMPAPAPMRGEPEHSAPMREEPEHPRPQGGDYPLLPSPPLEELELPPPPEGAELQLFKPASPRAAEPATPRAAEPAMPGEACSPSPGALLYPAEAFALPEILGPEPKRKEPSATGKGEEVRPPPPAIDALLEYAAPLSLPE
ncbi:hypothetical protein AOXY_G7420 [Acipenser oxyrinchus oxyrinchus]|uniref:Uncharacterized protein n=1 Tax=Acipenser oxyrinchus oxyrinchus TaxID=40147 RepID=A0AAD8LMM4_ACIOX|nr:hypothetical protein AOXY_G7420 [Acipenser oxyrinchus oxyrinchus]